MSLTLGHGPLSRSPAQTNYRIESPAHRLFFEPSPRRVRVVFGGKTVADSTNMRLLHETGLLPKYYFPREDVGEEFLAANDKTTHCPFKGDASYWDVRVGDRVAEAAVWGYPEPLEGAPDLAGYVAFDWDAPDAWYEEDEQIVVHPKDPYHRVDALESRRRVTVRVGGEVVAESDRPVLVFETGLPTRYYLPREDVRSELLEDSDKETGCPYKGRASYHSVRAGGELHEDLAWYYPEPNPGLEKITDRLAFFNDRVDLQVDALTGHGPGT